MKISQNIMKYFETSKCCCCVNDLKTAGRILAAISLFGIFQSGFGGSLFNFIILVGTAVAWFAWLYGIQSRNTDYMTPALVTQFVCLGFLVASLIIFPIFCCFSIETVQRFLDARLGNNKAEASTFCVYVWFILTFCTVVQWHFVAVMYSLRKSMLDEKQLATNVIYPANLA